MKTKKRKFEHIEICLKSNVERGRTGFDDIKLIHNSLPEVNYDSIDLSLRFLGKKLNYPILIESMTGGCEEAEKINKNLAWAAEKLGIGFGVGSQRAALEDNSLVRTYYVRDVAPTTFVFGNLGVLPKMDLEKYQQAIDMIEADALTIHLNPLQEVAQQEGDKNWSSGYEHIKKIVSHVNKPVIVKETGAGISGSVAIKLESLGVSAIDVSGYGGTNWFVVEKYRGGKEFKEFEEWGIPTAVSLFDVRRNVKIPVIASGGIRNGLDAVKALVIGANVVGVALPLLKEAVKGRESVLEWLEKFIDEMKMTMFLVGASSLEELKEKRFVVLGRTREWIEQL